MLLDNAHKNVENSEAYVLKNTVGRIWKAPAISGDVQNGGAEEVEKDKSKQWHKWERVKGHVSENARYAVRLSRLMTA
jgi:hypothetical protein